MHSLSDDVVQIERDVKMHTKYIIKYIGNNYNSIEKNNNIVGDGNCLFHAILDALNVANIINKDIYNHISLRNKIVAFVRSYKDYFSKYLYDSCANMDEWCDRMNTIGYYGDNICIMAASMIFRIPMFIILLNDPPNTNKMVIPYGVNYFTRTTKYISLLLEKSHYGVLYNNYLY